MTLSTKLFVAYQPSSKLPDLSWLNLKTRPEMIKQEGKSLGEKLVHAFGIAFGKGFRQVVIIGSDSPNLPSRYLDQAFTAMNGADMVIGPALDGGYYLIGLSRPSMTLFDDVSWSTDQVFERTTQNAAAQGYHWRALPNHYDIDTIDDLQTLHRELSRDGISAPATKRYLTALARGKALFQPS
jgi:rSAM/selenodomain-associated transferase 1